MSAMDSHFPPRIRALEDFEGAFDAHRLPADNCEVLFATYPAGTTIDDHSHETDNVGVITQGCLVLTVEGVERRYNVGDWYHVPANVTHAASFESDSAEIEFWFDA